jgi:H+/Cl- antiporter ClcA
METSRASSPGWVRTLAKWAVATVWVALVAGLSSGLFLWALEHATNAHGRHPWLIWLLPVAGLFSGYIYWKLGQASEAGNNLILREIRDPQAPIPFLMAPLVLGGTLLTHLFGGSAGREGTAVQMAGSLSDIVSKRLHLTPSDRRILLRASIAGGFAAVFGTPLAGTLFALEVVASKGSRWAALFPALGAALLADQVVRLLPVHHTHYDTGTLDGGPGAWIACLGFGLVAGLVARTFAGATRSVGGFCRRHVAWPPLRPFLGGLVVACLAALVGTQWLGLGIPGIVASFSASGSIMEPLGKLVFTALTVGSGFKGGEVTPLFHIGSTLGSALAPLLHMEVGTLAAVGFVAVFAGATNTPLACTMMAIELFGPGIAPLAGLACAMAWVTSGRPGIYPGSRA